MTPRREAYCQAVAEGLNPFDAVKKAGYKASSASKQVSRLANDQKVLNRIAELQAIAHIKKSDEERTQATDLPPKVQKKVSALEFLENTLNDVREPMKVRIQAAVVLLPYQEAKLAPKGKKEGLVETAQKASTGGKFATRNNQAQLKIM